MTIRLSKWSRAYIVLTVIVVVVQVVREHADVVARQNNYYSIIVSNCRSAGGTESVIEACLSGAWAKSREGIDVALVLGMAGVFWFVAMVLLYVAIRAALGVFRWVMRGH